MCPGVPAPGPDFQRYAEDLAGDRPVAGFLETLYTLALYQSWFSMVVQIKGAPKRVQLIPGHLWSDEKPEGPRGRADVMVIAKMPGRDEARDQRHFAGLFADTFAEALQRVGCSTSEFTNWYMTSFIKFAHPAPHLGKTIPTDWKKDCRPLLQLELRLVKPKYILCLGSEVGKELMGDSGAVNTSIGKVFDYNITMADGTIHTAKLMVCIDPRAVSMSPDTGPQLESSLRLFHQLTQGSNVGALEKDIEHVAVDTETTTLIWLDKMMEETKNGGAIAVDCEWEGEQPGEPGSWLRTVQVSHKAKFALCIVMRECGGAPAVCTSAKVTAKLHELFASTPKRKIRPIGHFHRADLPWLIHHGVDLTKAFEAPGDPVIGWEQTVMEGGFDTGTAAHSVCETDDFKLEVQATRHTGCPRYDTELQIAKKALAKQLKTGVDGLTGYGLIPSEVLYPYACYDVDVTRRLFDVYNGVDGKPGLLDYDEYGNNCRMAFWISMRASPACFEMEQVGMLVDIKRAESLVDMYRTIMSKKLGELKQLIRWDRFNLNSPFDCRELLFGIEYRGQWDKETQLPLRASPPEARLCSLRPIKSTSKQTKKSWEEIEMSGELRLFSASTDKESLGILFHQTKKDEVGLIVGGLRDIKFLGQLLKTTLKPPSQTQVTGKDDVDEDGERVYDAGLLSYICSDYRIRTHIFQTLETGRYASARPNLQNISKRREADYKRIAGAGYLHPLRSIFVASPGHVLIEADYVGAELAGMAWMSGDPTMIEHVKRAQLNEKDPNYYDIHSAVAVAAFRLNCEPTKAGLESIGMLHLRVAAKNVVFGYAYGRGAAAICRQAKEEGVNIAVEEAQALIDGLTAQYPLLPVFFDACRHRTYDEMFMMNCFGRARRFRPTTDRKVSGDQERQGMNYPIQSLVADAMSRALDHLYFKRDAYGLHYKIVLQIHDAVILEVPVDEIDAVYDRVLPECMTDLVDIRPCDLDGLPINDDVYHLGIDREVYLQWGEKLTNLDQAQKLGIPERFVKVKK